ncbi:hypothetical protein TRAPUB_1669 [Trametes pubescens]|uniref:Uncharacterized protein n=1 Tax=Trametes pubescens TaxID=154538 RepID=A0A1M2VIQ3_TRAPU|nr:hypothetical protein TRAPUB_1669 [Trametes pubescens]
MEDWMLVLKLTTMWRFDDLRRTAISTLTQHVQKSDPVTWLCLARQYNVGDWLSPSLLALVKREMPMQMEDVGPLGVETVVKIAELREGAARGRDYNGSYAVHTRPLSVPMEIARLFDEELKQARENY